MDNFQEHPGYSETEIEALKVAVKQYQADYERLAKRDCNATVQLCFNDGNDPFAREDLKIVDVGVSDNIYIVESQTVTNLQAEVKKLKAKELCTNDCPFETFKNS
jgi:hypothetical protein